MVIKNKEDLKSFVFYETFFFTIQRIKDPKERCEAYDTLANYWLYWTLPDEIDNDWTQQLMENAVPLLDAAKKRRIASIENWKKWWRPKKDWDNLQKPSNNLDETKTKPRQNLNVNVNDNVNVNVNDNINDNINNNINNKEKEIKEKESEEDLRKLIRKYL